MARRKEETVSRSPCVFQLLRRPHFSTVSNVEMSRNRDGWKKIGCFVSVERRHSVVNDVDHQSPQAFSLLPCTIVDPCKKRYGSIMLPEIIPALRTEIRKMDEEKTKWRAKRIRERAARMKRLDESLTASGEIERPVFFNSYESYWTTRWYCVVSLLMSLEEYATQMTREILRTRREANNGFFPYYDAYSRLFTTPICMQGHSADEVTYNYVLYMCNDLGVSDAAIIVNDVQQKFDIAYPQHSIDVSKTMHLLPKLAFHRGKSLFVT